MDIQWLLKMPQQMTESATRPTATVALRAGDQLTALVLDVVKDNDVLLAVGQFKAYARLPLPVVTGQDRAPHPVQRDPARRLDRLRGLVRAVQDRLGEFQVPIAVFIPGEFVQGLGGQVEAVIRQLCFDFGDHPVHAGDHPAVEHRHHPVAFGSRDETMGGDDFSALL